MTKIATNKCQVLTGDEFCASLYDPERDPNCLINTPLFH